MNCYNLKYNRFLRPPEVIEHPSHPPPRAEPESSRFTNKMVEKPACSHLSFLLSIPTSDAHLYLSLGVGSSLNLRPSVFFSQESLGKRKVVGGRCGRRGRGQAVLDSPYKVHK